MKIVKMIGGFGFVISIVAFIITHSIEASIVSLGFASFNLGIIAGERGRK